MVKLYVAQLRDQHISESTHKVLQWTKLNESKRAYKNKDKQKHDLMAQ